MSAAPHNIHFDPESHTYTCDGVELISVTRLIARLKPPFDAQAAAERVAQREGGTAQELLDEWERKRQRSLERGERVHQYIRERLAPAPAAPADPWLALNPAAAYPLPEERAWEAFWELARGRVRRVVHVEHIVGDPALGVAGTLDCLLETDERLHLWDWKTGSRFEESNRWGRTLLAPFDDLPDCELSLYSLQLSLYRLLLERALPADQLGDSYILHLAPEPVTPTYRVHKALDLRQRLAAWLTTL